MQPERRVERSDQLSEALGMQLTAICRRARFKAVVLTEEQGLTVASIGECGDLEEIAVHSPQLAPGNRVWQGRIRTADGASRLVTVAPVDTGDGHLYLCAMGGVGNSINAELLLGGRGVSRILS